MGDTLSISTDDGGLFFTFALLSVKTEGEENTAGAGKEEGDEAGELRAVPILVTEATIATDSKFSTGARATGATIAKESELSTGAIAAGSKM